MNTRTLIKLRHWLSIILWLFLAKASAFWDIGTTTVAFTRTDVGPQRSRFRWQRTESEWFKLFFPWWDWYELTYRRRLFVIAGITHEFVNLSTAAILNRRTLITSANYLDPYMGRQRELRIWALGRNGDNDTPFRYRVWRITRIFPRSVNPEHQHGPFAYHCPRHDVAMIHSLDQMYIFKSPPWRYHYAYRTFIPHRHHYALERNDAYFAGSGFEYLQHIYENYKIFYHRLPRTWCVDCSKYIPKWWGKFMCFINKKNVPGLPNGAALLDHSYLIGIGCFEIRYNEDKVFVFTDLRYYNWWIYAYGHIYPGEYYEYAYPQWSVYVGLMYDSDGNYPYIPAWQLQGDIYPFGKK